MNPFENQKCLSGIRHVIAVGSGKGGVGKSTVALNLALSLKQKGFKVGLMDADLYGPSIPSLVGAKDQKMVVENEKLIPVVKYGIKIVSIGFLVDEDSAVIWRGPMLFKAIEQFLTDVFWGELDFLIVDLPPGTGDVALTLAQKIPVSGGIVVCTPQNLALADAKKALSLFKEVQIPILGVIENMSAFETSEGKVHLFPKGQIDSYLKVNQVRKLGQIPFYLDIGICSESGVPFVESQKESVFKELAQDICQILK